LLLDRVSDTNYEDTLLGMQEHVMSVQVSRSIKTLAVLLAILNQLHLCGQKQISTKERAITNWSKARSHILHDPDMKRRLASLRESKVPTSLSEAAHRLAGLAKQERDKIERAKRYIKDKHSR